MMRRQATIRRGWIALLLGALLGAGVAWLIRWPAPITAIDLSQTRLDTALPLPRGEVEVRAGFVPAHDGLASIELLLVDYGGDEPAGSFALTLLDAAGTEIAAQAWSNEALAHNQVLNWQLPLQSRSAGSLYTLVLSGDDGNQVTAWGTSLNVLGSATLAVVGAEPAPAQELRFVTRYRLTFGGALRTLAGPARELPRLLLVLAFMAMPGALLLVFWRGPRVWDPGAWAGAALALGMAVWPLLWLWLTVLGGRWTREGLLVATIAGWLATLIQAWRRRRMSGRRYMPASGWPWFLALLGVLIVGLLVRMLAVRDLAFPPWVDSSRHALITRLMLESGQFPRSYEPLLPVARTPYHYGFHALAASTGLLLGGPLESHLLELGQWLNGLVPLAVYAGAWLLTRHRGASVLVAFLVALPFFFPAYYATWGRYTQLTGLILWPLLLSFTWVLARGGRPWGGSWPLVGLLFAGLFLTHFRLFLLTLPFVLVAWALGGGRRWRELAGASVLGFAAVLPRFVELAQTMRGAQLASTIVDYNAFPVGYIRTGWEPAFLAAAIIGILLSLPAAWRRRHWAAWPTALIVWLGASWLALSGRVPGLPDSWLINVNSAYIALFVPQVLLFAVLVWRGARWSRGWLPAPKLLTAALLGAWLTAGLLFGMRQQVTILNEGTVLAFKPDREAIRWLARKAPPESVVAVNSWQWLGQAWAGSDGGAWITPLTGLRTTTPPVDYVYDRDLLASVDAFNQAAAARESWATPEAADWLREQGVTYVFVGVRGGFFDPAELLVNPGVRLVYGEEGAFVFALDRPSP